MTHDHALPGGWHHLAAVRADGLLRLYVDGALVADIRVNSKPPTTTFQPRSRCTSVSAPSATSAAALAMCVSITGGSQKLRLPQSSRDRVCRKVCEMNFHSSFDKLRTNGYCLFPRDLSFLRSW